MTIKVVIAGPRGKMGSEAIKMVKKDMELRLVACIDRQSGLNNDLSIPVYENAENCFREVDADVLIDLTVPGVGFKHAKIALKHKVRPVVGTSGFTTEQISELTELSKKQKIGGIIAPNFAIGAVLMMKFSMLAAKYFPDVEIIEKHHDQKLDAPSGTAVKTAEMIKEVRQYKQQGNPNETEVIAGARGGELDGIHIHSIRLPGLIAHQEVMFGSSGQLLTIKHDSFNRESFMTGVKFAVEKVFELDQLIYGLENILD